MMIFKIFDYIKAKINIIKLKRFNSRLRKQCLSFGYKSVIYPPFKIGFKHKFSLGNHCRINPGVFINASGSVEIGDGTIFGPEVIIYSTNHNYKTAECLPFSRTDIYAKVTIGANCWIGTRVIILPGVSIGEGSIVGAGAVVSKSCPPGSILVGNPAKVVKTRDMAYYEELVKKGEYIDFSEGYKK